MRVGVSPSLTSFIVCRRCRQDNPRERMRVRGNSFTLQMDLDGVKLGTNTEVSNYILPFIGGLVPRPHRKKTCHGY